MLKKIELKEISIKIERVNDDEKESEAVHEPLVLAPVSPKEVKLENSSEEAQYTNIKEEVEDIDDVDIDDLLKGDDDEDRKIEQSDDHSNPKEDPETAQTQDISTPNHTQMMLIECPTCLEEFQGLNRLRLHIETNHEMAYYQVCCPICQKVMQTKHYEDHILQNHSEYLYKYDQFNLSPKGVLHGLGNKTLVQGVERKGGLPPKKISNIIQFNALDPWKEILSVPSRQKRYLDAIMVGNIKSRKVDKYEYQGETSLDNKVNASGSKDIYNKLTQKVEFICGLELNSHYKKYLQRYKEYKTKKEILKRFKDRMSETQTEKFEERLKADFLESHQMADPEIHINRQVLPRNMSVRDFSHLEEFITDNIKKRATHPSFQHPLYRNISRYPYRASNTVEKFKPSVRIQKNIRDMVANNCVILPTNNGSGPSSIVILRDEPKDPLAIEEDQEEDPIQCQSISTDSVIALNIPMEDIVDNTDSCKSGSLKLKNIAKLKQEC